MTDGDLDIRSCTRRVVHANAQLRGKVPMSRIEGILFGLYEAPKPKNKRQSGLANSRQRREAEIPQ
jgi:hypothetical protein